MDSLIVSEIFGPTIQGEGPSIGRRTLFLRLGICNLKCQWCDTAYTWDWKNYDYRQELRRMTAREVLEGLLALGPADMLVVSGGEPLLQSRKLATVLHTVKLWDWRVEIETAGTVEPYGLWGYVDCFNVSPKLSNSGNELSARLHLDVLRKFASVKSCFKFVVQSITDLDEVEDFVVTVPIPSNRVYIMPEGITTERILAVQAEIVDEVIKRGWNLTTRLHVLLKGDQRGF